MEYSKKTWTEYEKAMSIWNTDIRKHRDNN